MSFSVFNYDKKVSYCPFCIWVFSLENYLLAVTQELSCVRDVMLDNLLYIKVITVNSAILNHVSIQCIGVIFFFRMLVKVNII